MRIVFLALICTALATPFTNRAGTRYFDDGCTTIVVAPKASEDGSIMTTHTADCFDCDFRMGKVPARDHKAGDMRPVQPIRLTYPRYVGFERGEMYHPSRLEEGFYPWGLTQPAGHIPQSTHTNSYLDAIYGLMNEHQLAIGEGTCGSKLWALPVFAGGKAMMDVSELTRIAMERCATARCAIQLMGDMAVKYGYYGATWTPPASAQASGGEALTVVDTKEAWVFHISADDTGTSAVWVAQRVPDDHIAVVANGFTIRKIDLNNKDYYMASSNIFEVAIRAKLWDPQTSEFDYMEAYALHVSVYHEEYIARRWWRVLDYAAPSLQLPGNATTTQLPFSVKPDRPMGVKDLFTLNRDHYEGTKYDMTKGLQAGPFGSPNRADMYMDATREVQPDLMGKGHFERPISMYRTSYSFVSQSRSWLPNVIGGRVWFANHAPHASVYAPFYASASEVALEYQTGSLFRLRRDSAWWAFCAVENYADKIYNFMIQDVKAAYTQLEQQALDESAAVERQALLAMGGEGGVEAARGLVSDYSLKFASELVATWWEFLDYLMTTYHDGVKIVPDPAVDKVTPYKIFFPKWWLEAINWWHQPEDDIAAKEPEPDPEAPTPAPAAAAVPAAPAPAAPANPAASRPTLLMNNAAPSSVPAASLVNGPESSSSGWGSFALASVAVVAFGLGVFVGRYRKADYDAIDF